MADLLSLWQHWAGNAFVVIGVGFAVILFVFLFFYLYMRMTGH
jgi:hypothetical protein